jgi:hypothetical protein
MSNRQFYLTIPKDLPDAAPTGSPYAVAEKLCARNCDADK